MVISHVPWMALYGHSHVRRREHSDIAVKCLEFTVTSETRQDKLTGCQIARVLLPPYFHPLLFICESKLHCSICQARQPSKVIGRPISEELDLTVESFSLDAWSNSPQTEIKPMI